MTHFIELTQKTTVPFSSQEVKRIISVAVEKIDCYYDNHIVLANRIINVSESYNEIKNKINIAFERRIV